MMNFAAARQNMIECQLRPNRVIDERLLDSLALVPREDFVPAAAKPVAYIDGVVSLPNGRALLEPMILGRLLQDSAVKSTDKVLNIAGATGYAAAILAGLAANVVLVEEDAALAQTATANLQKYANVQVLSAALTAGSAENGPYDVILVEGGIYELPASLLNQLKDGGRLLAVQMGKGPVGQATMWQRVGDSFSSRPLFDAVAPLLNGFTPKPAFVF